MPRSRKATALTAERGPIHGNFAEGAAVTQGVMGIFQGTSRWPQLSPARREAIHMIVHKLHRIATGNPNHADHWDDIAGYAHLGATDGVSGEVPTSLTQATRQRPARKVQAKKAKTKKVTARAAPAKKRKAKAKTNRARPVRGNNTAGPAPATATNPAPRRPRATRPTLATVTQAA